MMKMFVKPKDGVKIRRPDNGRVLSPEGEEVPKNTFWRRRVMEGDVEEVEKKQKPAWKKPKSEKLSHDGGEK